ncbi:MAG: tRNA (guanosine(46)-N7)-methyltransferase TrmB [Gammaproteobacteria bacterium]|nr:MAG: tRNA (guanosine(46)-N7)-methyltransferase TrmB [Gammaproteobacteria bacterium]RLA11001.1 MAG: tRNA (guanosine(46)-N7)-methyltransferase TrmB [Gammaproteobacteria bacterium]RLA13809.1 MAG: tRNA (guanosine(46)-N7)-methyltransferase TrmB [Gammaproteobacteria bacterium]
MNQAQAETRPANSSTANHRPIRSFVIRSARMTTAQQKALDQHWEHYGIEAEESMLDYGQLFGRTANTYLEIGFGMGQSLVKMAGLRSEDNFIGADVCQPGIGAVIGGAERIGLNNLKIHQGDAVELMRQRIPAESLSGVYVFFPDPWPKRRHHKRRLIQPEFVEVISSRLKPGGYLHVATDWQDYAGHISKTLQASPTLTNCADDGPYSPRPDYRSLTKYEARGQRLGHGVWDIIYRRK